MEEEDFWDDDVPEELYEGGSPEVEEIDIEKRITAAENAPERFEPINFGEYSMLCHLLSSKILWTRAQDILLPEYFTAEHKPVIRYLQKYWRNYGKMPTIMMIQSETGVALEEQPDADRDDIVEELGINIEEFCRTKSLEDFIIRSADMIGEEGGKLSRDTSSALFKEVQHIDRISIKKDLGFEIHESIGKVLTLAKNDVGISTGLKHLDLALDGGVTRPSFNIVSASTGDGKSVFLQNIASYYSLKNNNVVFYSLELEPAIIAQRFAAIKGGFNIKKVFYDADTVQRRMTTQGLTSGKLYVVKLPMAGTTMSNIIAHYNDLTLETGLHFGVVCIDYIDIMNPIEKIDKANIHLKDKYVAEEMNDWFHQTKLIGWTASQQTKGAQDEKDARQSGVAGGAPKISTCDNLFILKRSMEDRKDKKTWLHIKKARSSGGVNKQVPIHWEDDTTLRMTDGDDSDYRNANSAIDSEEVTKKEVSEVVSTDALFRDANQELKDRIKRKNKAINEAEDTTGKEKNASTVMQGLRDKIANKNSTKEIGDSNE